jgi:hypothetical protein
VQPTIHIRDELVLEAHLNADEPHTWRASRGPMLGMYCWVWGTQAAQAIRFDDQDSARYPRQVNGMPQGILSPVCLHAIAVVVDPPSVSI